LWDIIETLWRNIEHLRIKAKHDRLSHCGNIESVYGINKSFSGNHNPTLQEESVTIDMKAVVNDYKSSCEIIHSYPPPPLPLR